MVKESWKMVAFIHRVNKADLWFYMAAPKGPHLPGLYQKFWANLVGIAEECSDLENDISHTFSNAWDINPLA